MAKASTGVSAPARKSATKTSVKAAKAVGRSITDFQPLLPAEKKLLVACRAGRELVLSPTRPDTARSDICVRATFIRFLALGGDEQNPVHEDGVKISGAWIEGEFNIAHCTIRSPLALRRSVFTDKIAAISVTIDALYLDGSSVPGIDADSLRCIGSLFLRNGFSSNGAVRLLDADIGSAFDCSRGSFSNQSENALLGDRMRVAGITSLGEGFTARGRVSFITAKLEGGLDCEGATFENPGKVALGCDGAEIGTGLFWRDLRSVDGTVALTGCHVETLLDDLASWDTCSYVKIDGFRYDRIIGFCDAESRIAWLLKQDQSSLGKDFRPQPWEQLARTLRDMGHVEAARSIAIEKHWVRSRAGKIGQRAIDAEKPWRSAYHTVLNWMSYILHLLYGILAGFGHRPLWTLGWVVLVWLGCGYAYQEGEKQGVFGPSSPIIQTSSAMAACGAPGDRDQSTAEEIAPLMKAKPHQAIAWTRCPAVPSSYTTFHPYIYSLDLLLPVIDLQQQDAWSPMVSNRANETLWWGFWLRYLLWAEILFGWLSGALLIAVLGKLVDKD